MGFVPGADLEIRRNSEFFEIMDMLDKRLNDKGKNWRHVLKALKVLDYCLHEGSENVVVWAKDNIYIIKTLREFQFLDEEGRDQGANGIIPHIVVIRKLILTFTLCQSEYPLKKSPL